MCDTTKIEDSDDLFNYLESNLSVELNLITVIGPVERLKVKILLGTKTISEDWIDFPTRSESE